MLSKTVQVGITGKGSSQAEVLGFEDHRRSRSIKKNFSIRSGDSETERSLGIAKLQLGLHARHGIGNVGSWEHRLGDLIDCLVLVLNNDVESRS